mmetsp:Transcript_39079/g.60884  ORF Transcript_39079/g.60884 Transcript_39079/m.60884 type:complete len:300 (+) Transcript_39079:2-901(+)
MLSRDYLQVVMDDLIQGQYLLKWAKGLLPIHQARASHSLKPCSANANDHHIIFDSASAYMDADRGVRSLSKDVTHFSSSMFAVLVREISEIPGLVDWLGHGASEADREAFHQAILSLAEFSEARREKDLLPLKALVSEDYRAVLTFYLLQCSEDRRLSLCNLFYAIMLANDMDGKYKIKLLEEMKKITSPHQTPKASSPRKLANEMHGQDKLQLLGSSKEPSSPRQVQEDKSSSQGAVNTSAIGHPQDLNGRDGGVNKAGADLALQSDTQDPLEVESIASAGGEQLDASLPGAVTPSNP